MSASATLPDSPAKQVKPRNSSVVRKSTHKPASVQSAIVARRMSGQSKRQIAQAEGIAVNTVTSILELNDVDTQIAKARQDTVALAPLAVSAIERDLNLPAGSGALGLRLLNDIGAIGEDAIDAARRNNRRQTGAINVLVAPGAAVTVNATAGNNNDAVPQVNNDTPQRGADTDSNNNSTITSNNKVTATVTRPARRPGGGKQPRDGVGR